MSFQSQRFSAEPVVFPDGFLWGGATSAHQVEGQNIHNDWWAWEQAGRVTESSANACDHYNRFAADFDLAVSLGHKAHRFSIEWSRIEPQEGQWRDEVIAHYGEVVDALRARHLEPVVTLHHFTTPQWLAAGGSWTNPKIVDAFARFVERVARALKGRVRYWVTINEPMVFVNMHYLEGIGPPGLKDLRQAYKVTEHLIRAHAAAYRILHEQAQDGVPAQVSVAAHTGHFVPCRPWHPLDRVVSALTDQIFNAAFIEALTEGRWAVPGIAKFNTPEARNTLDYLGINYYGRQFIRSGPGGTGQWVGQGCNLDHHPREVRERTGMGWDVHPETLYHVLLRWKRLGVPSFILENGTWMADDRDRWRYLSRHIYAMGRAMQAGAQVLGYCVWSLMDNYEWAHGFKPRFGIVEVDYATQARRVRDSGRRLAEVYRTNRLSLSD